MQLVKLITLKRIKTLRCFFPTILVSILVFSNPVFAQDNSPYSRYGIGDLVPVTHIISKGMGGISAGYADRLSINFSNPASYSSFESGIEPKSKKLVFGRTILDFGVNLENRSLTEPATSKTFSASNALFSYLQVGVPLKSNWGFSFGLRPLSRVSYKIFRNERLFDPITGLPIDSSNTRFEGDGGSYLASIGTGFSIFRRVKADLREEKLSLGLNAGYLFGSKDFSTRRTLINDSVAYYKANYETQTNYNGIYLNAGLQYKLPVGKKAFLTTGVYGSLGHKLNATQDILRETFVFDDNLGEVRLDSVSDRRDIKGKIMLPTTYTIGFLLQKPSVPNKESGWLLGLDFEQQNWDQYRLYGQKDSVRNKWELRVGGQLNPAPKRNYFSNVSYRAGFFLGPDYIKVGQKMSQFGGSFGLGLPIRQSRQAPNQVTIVNVAFEYSKRGNNDNLLKESMFKFTLGFSLSDYWFIKRKYD
ncbi:MAG: hypothetical protein ABIR30_07580 [Chitinophagaceae bacterium]